MSGLAWGLALTKLEGNWGILGVSGLAQEVSGFRAGAWSLAEGIQGLVHCSPCSKKGFRVWRGKSLLNPLESLVKVSVPSPKTQALGKSHLESEPRCLGFRSRVSGTGGWVVAAVQTNTSIHVLALTNHSVLDRGDRHRWERDSEGLAFESHPALECNMSVQTEGELAARSMLIRTRPRGGPERTTTKHSSTRAESFAFVFFQRCAGPLSLCPGHSAGRTAQIPCHQRSEQTQYRRIFEQKEMLTCVHAPCLNLV